MMRYIKFLSFSIVMLILFSLGAYSQEEPYPYADSPYKAMKAYVVNVSGSDALDASESAFSLEKEFRYPATESVYVDPNAAQQRVYTERGVQKRMTYAESKTERYMNRVYDVYLYGPENTIQTKYMFERETGRFVFYDKWVQSETCVGEGFSSDEEIIEHAQTLVLPYLSEMPEGYEATIYRMDYGSFYMYDVLLEYKIENVVISRIRTVFPDAGYLAHLELTEYRENASDLVVAAGKDTSARSAIEERVVPVLEDTDYTRYEIQPGFLYYDEEDRPYILYNVHFHSEEALDYVDFMIYIE